MDILVQAVSLVTAAFSLGGVTILSLHYRTDLLRIVVLFVASLGLLCLGFLLQSLQRWGGGLASMGGLQTLVQLSGAALNMFVLPFLVAALRNRAFGRVTMRVWFAYSILFVVLALATFLVSPGPLITTLAVLQVGGIAFMVVVLALSHRDYRHAWWGGAVRQFLLASSVFLVLLTVDMAITIVPLAPLSAFDGLSLPLYLIFLCVGLFFFSVKFLSRDALVEGDSLTEECRRFFDLTARETELVEALLRGGANKEVAAELGIAVKTVENHLSKCYAKLGVSSRIQLVQALRNWRKEP